MSANNIRARLYYSDAWQVTPSYERVDVNSSWGLQDEGTAIGVSSCTLQLNNRSGDYSPSDARSNLYGLINRNTPGRVYLDLGLDSGDLQNTSDDFGVDIVNDWGTIWQTAAPGAGSSADFDVTSGFGTMSLATADSDSPRIAYAQNVNARDVDCAVTFKAPQSTGARLFVDLRVRGDATDVTSAQILRVELGLSNQVIMEVYARTGDLLDQITVSGLTHTGTGQPLRMRVLAAGNRIHGKIWIAADAEPDAWQLVVVDTDSDTAEVPRSGWVGVAAVRETGNTNSSTPQFSFDDWESTTLIPIADGAVAKWTPDRDEGYDPDTHVGGDAWTDIEINGPSERANSSKATLSAIRRSMLAASPDAYWPLEDPDGTTDPLSGLEGGSPGHIESGTPTFGNNPDGLLSASVSLVKSWTTAEDGLIFLPLEGFASGYIQVECVAGAPNGVATDLLIEVVSTTSDHQFSTLFTGSTHDGRLHHYALTLENNGANVDYTIYKDGAIITAANFPGDIGVPIGLRIGGGISGGSSPGSAIYIGHVAAWQAFNDPAGRGLCATGYIGESAPDRFMRLCDEHGIAGGVTGDVSLGANGMGMQQPDTLSNLFVECASTDAGMVADGRAWYGLEFRTGRSLVNQDAALSLTYGVNVAPPIKPVADLLGIANDITATDPLGNTARAAKSTGPLNTSDPVDDPEGIGRVEGSVSANPELASSLQDIAGWNLNTSTDPGSRYQQVTIDLSKHPELLADCMALRMGDLITIDSLDADQVELLVLGGTHNVVSYHHKLTLNCTPAGSYRVATVGNTSELSRIGSRTSSLGQDFVAGTDTAMSVVVTGPRWQTSGATPFHVRVGGAVLNVTAVSVGAELATVGTAAHADNAGVTPGMPASVAVNDAMLMWACCRNTALTAPTVTGWTKILTVGQGALYFKRATVTGGGSAPTVTYAGTAAGDTVSAQISRWRQLDPETLDTSSGVQSNGSAQDIAVPALARPTEQNTLVLLLAWKQDDITGLTPPTGFTEIDRFSTTVGGDQFMYWAYALQSDRAAVDAATITITGGAAAISKAILVAFRGWQTFTVDAVTVNGITRTIRTTDPTALKRIELEHPVFIGA